MGAILPDAEMLWEKRAIERLMEAPLADLPRDDRAEAGLPDEDHASRMAGELGAALV
jgi:hypothetical protein